MTFCSLSHVLQPRHGLMTVARDADQRYTQKEFLSAVHTLHATLAKHTETRWLLIHDNTYTFAVGLLGLLAAGKAVCLPPNAQPGTLLDLAQHADAVLDKTILDPIIVDPIVLDQRFLDNTDPDKTILDLDTSVITLLTSGSTGEPKAIRKTLRCLDAEIRVLEWLWGETLGNADVIATVSHQHIYGLLFRLLWPLCAGRSFAAHTHLYPEPLVAEVLSLPRAVLVSSPSQLKRFPTDLDLSAVRSNLVTVFSSGGPLPQEAAQDWQRRLGQAPVEVFGSTETGGVAWRQRVTADAPWQPLPGVQLSADENQNLLVASPFIGNNDTLAMGDRVELQPDGHFHLLGRTDRIVKIEEKRLSLTSMEQHLLASPLIDDARVLVLPNASGRLGVVATLTKTGKSILDEQGKPILTQLFRNHLANHFERVLLPRKWRFPEYLPTDRQGKIPQAALIALFTDNENGCALTEVTASNETHRQVQIILPLESRLFEGHFPDLPILPGVMQFDMAARQCAGWYPLTAFRRIDKLKFQEPVVPGDTITLSLQNLGKGQVQFSYTLDGKPLSSGRIVFAQ